MMGIISRKKIVVVLTLVILLIITAAGVILLRLDKDIRDSEASTNINARQGFPGYRPPDLTKESPDDRKTGWGSTVLPSVSTPEEETIAQFVSGEIIVSIKDADTKVKIRSDRINSINMDGSDFMVSDLDQQPLPQSIKAIENKYGIKELGKVFKGKESPQITNQSESLQTDLSSYFKITLEDDGQTLEALDELQQSPEILSADLNYLHYTTYTPNDPLYSQQWAHQNTKAGQGWDTTLGSENVKIAIIDSGVDYDHEDLKANMVGNCTNGCPNGAGYDFVDIDTTLWESWGYSLIPGEDYTTSDNKPSDFNGHGTHVSGIAAAVGNNSKGIIGTCPRCKILPVRVGFSIKIGSGIFAGTFGVMESDAIAKGIIYAADNGADIISMSFGGGYDSQIQSAIEYAQSMEVVLIASAGNSGMDYPFASYPAAYEGVISVASINNQNKRSLFSDYGYWVDIAAPGENILSTVPKTGTLSSPSGYLSLSGTSMSAPYAAGVAGLILSKNPTWDAEQVREALVTGVYNPVTVNKYLGHGIHDIPKALSTNQFSTSTALILSPDNGTVVDGNVAIEGTTTGNSYTVSVGSGIYPTNWTDIATGTKVINGGLANWNTAQFGTNMYTIRLTVNDSGKTKTAFKRLNLEKGIRPGWPVQIGGVAKYNQNTISHSVEDINNNGIQRVITHNTINTAIYSLDGKILEGWPRTSESGGGEGSHQISIAIGRTNGQNKEILFTDVMDSYHPEQPKATSYCFNNYLPSGISKNGWPKRCDDAKDEGTSWWAHPKWTNLTGLSLRDLNNDGRNEVIGVHTVDGLSGPSLTKSNNTIYVFSGDGSNLPGWPVKLPLGYVKEYVGGVVTADIDNESTLELMFFARDPEDNISLFIYESNGQLKTGYPKKLNFKNQYHVGGPVLVDIDGDGSLEIPVFSKPGFCDINGAEVRYINIDGTTVPGWPAKFDLGIPSLFAPTVGDLDKDGKVETIFGTSGEYRSDSNLCYLDDYKVYAFRNDGSLMPGWPVNVKGQVLAQATIGDVDGDNYPDVLVSTTEGYVYAMNRTGNIINGFPKIMDRDSSSGVEIGDFDNDGKVEIISSTTSGQVYIWDLPSQYNHQTMLWPVFMKDSMRSGLYSGTPTPAPTLPPVTLSITPSPTSTTIPSTTSTVVPSPTSTKVPSTISPTPLPSPSAAATPSPTSTPIPGAGFVCGPADINNDGKLNIVDLGLLGKGFASFYQKACKDVGVDYGPCGGKDVNKDGKINIFDFGAPENGFAHRYGKSSCALP